MVNEVRENVKMRKTAWGYEIFTVDPWCKVGHMYVNYVHSGQVEWVTDYTHAKHYKSKAYAEALVKKIKEGGVRV